MKPKTPERTEHDLFRLELVNMINLRHELVKLAQVIDWQALNDAFEPLYHGETGRPGNNIRLMCGLHYLKHVYALSDEEVCARWVENPYYQYFCGNVY
ncbi:transposase, partial [Grimontia marina]|uniref:transposase n=1 Tax=Grimontia marina TaxID=646534 RepID=UPI0018DC1BDE